MNHTLSLTRWHKVAERVSAALKEHESYATRALGEAAISPWNKDGIEEKSAAMATHAKNSIRSACRAPTTPTTSGSSSSTPR